MNYRMISRMLLKHGNGRFKNLWKPFRVDNEFKDKLYNIIK